MKFPGDPASQTYEKPCNLVFLRQLIPRLLSSSIQSPKELGTWIDQNSHGGENSATASAP